MVYYSKSQNSNIFLQKYHKIPYCARETITKFQNGWILFGANKQMMFSC